MKFKSKESSKTSSSKIYSFRVLLLLSPKRELASLMSS